ncbi:hypothetical protein GSI_09832 [Ganoderma sinense ZZ0214-1]|uniref:Uncharacterized protein n=1 Tax=Ganoderma sinense ZZ0214-1 TaxID=1077348 RepID=A0A2G8S2T1_9APHY|nr:hypothetical protein GSI_09832 [Ganoderma sinense ZZ0214-1]
MATLLVATKAWQSRRRFKGYLVAKVGGSQVEKLLTLLIESGAIYSAIWLVIVIFQISEYQYWDITTSLLPNQRFMDYFGIFLNGVLVPGIAIYPTIIIVLVALNKSHIERGISQHLDAVPTPCLATEVHTVDTNLYEDQAPTRSEVLVIGRPKSVCGSSALELEDERRCMDEEWKPEGITYAGQLQLKP